MKFQPATWVLLAATLGVVVLAHFDPWADATTSSGFVSTKSAARRAFDGLGELPPLDAVIEFAPVGGARVRLVPSPDGHAVEIDGVVAGPADPESVEGIWASLRMATTLRAVPDDVDTAASLRGTVEVTTAGQTHRVDIGGSTPDGVGLYGVIHGGASAGTWVLERELGLLLDQSPEAHLARRLLVLDVGDVQSVELGPQSVTRGADGLWRSAVAQGDATVTALLSTAAAEAKIDRLASARMEPFVPHGGAPNPEAAPTASVRLWDERALSVTTGNSCSASDRPDAVMAWRGLGWPGCVDKAVLEPWPLPGSGLPRSGRMVEPRLLPHPYVRVLRIEQVSPKSILRRRGGDWMLEYAEDGRPVTRELGAAEVLGWYAKLHEAEVNAEPDTAPDTIVWRTEFTLSTDAGVRLRLRCGDVGQEVWCQRDDGPSLRVRTDELTVGFTSETFADRTLAKLATENARSIEIRGARAVRQSAHFDMGVWRLDNPDHPGGDLALDEEALESLLAALAEIRAQRWTSVPSERPDRIVNVELIPSREGPNSLEVALHEDCVAVVETQAAVLDDATCRRLHRELLFADPLRGWIDGARSLEVTTLDDTGGVVRFERRGEALVSDASEGVDAARALLTGLSAARYPVLVPGDPATEGLVRLRILPRTGPAFDVEVGSDWAAIDGSPWHYRQAKAGAAGADAG